MHIVSVGWKPHMSKTDDEELYLMRKLNSFNVSVRILTSFYRSFIESLLTFSFVCWFNGLSLKDKNSLYSIVKTCSKIIGVKQRDLRSLWEDQLVRKAKTIISHPQHPLSYEFRVMPSGRRYVSPPGRSNRHLNSFIPSAIRSLNSRGIHM